MRERRGYWERLSQRRMGRRQVLKGAALGGVGLVAATAVGCAQEGPSSPAPAAGVTSAAETPRRGGVYTVGGRSNYFLQGSANHDPHIVPSSGAKAKAHTGIYSTLLDYDPRTFDPQPGLAQSWEQPSETELVFRLQPNVKWHNKPPVNGRDLKVEDIIFSLNRVRTNEPRFDSRTRLEPFDKIETRAANTLSILLKRPDGPALKRLSIDNMAILAPEVVERYQRLTEAAHVVGTGPFVMVSA